MLFNIELLVKVGGSQLVICILYIMYIAFYVACLKQYIMNLIKHPLVKIMVTLYFMAV